MEEGAQTVERAFAQVHVSTSVLLVFPGCCTCTVLMSSSRQTQGAGEVLRGTFNSTINGLTGDEEGKIEDEKVIQRGQREINSGRLDKDSLETFVPMLPNGNGMKTPTDKHPSQ